LATVLGNLQVVLVGPIAWLLLKERLRGRTLAAIPISLGGVVLISGAVGSGAYGRNPGLGVADGIVTAVSYAGFLLVVASRRSSCSESRACSRRSSSPRPGAVPPKRRCRCRHDLRPAQRLRSMRERGPLRGDREDPSLHLRSARASGASSEGDRPRFSGRAS